MIRYEGNWSIIRHETYKNEKITIDAHNAMYDHCEFKDVDFIITNTDVNITFNYCEFYNCSFEYQENNHLSFSSSFLSNCTVNSYSMHIDASYAKCCLFNVNEVIIKTSRLNFCDFEKEDMRGKFDFCVLLDCGTGAKQLFFPKVKFSSNNLVSGHTSNMFNFIPHCPMEGSFIAYKKLQNNTIATLYIPEDAKRVGHMSIKCRCDKAKVISIEDSNGQPLESARNAFHRETITYKVNEWVYADKFSEDKMLECAPGIHFFMSKEEAKTYSG